MGYEDDFLGSLYDDEGEGLEDPPALPMPTMAELRRGALYLGVPFGQLLEAAWGVSVGSIAEDDARVFGTRPPRRFGAREPSGLSLEGPWPGGSFAGATAVGRHRRLGGEPGPHQDRPRRPGPPR